MKKIAIILLILILIYIAGFFLINKNNNSQSKIFSGMVYDCTTNEPVSDARVQINLGNDIWNLFSDSGRHYEGQSDQFGNFSIKYGGGDGNVLISKEGYLWAQETFLGGKTKVGILKQSSVSDHDFTTLCKRNSNR
jgi:hypothetical protein